MKAFTKVAMVGMALVAMFSMSACGAQVESDGGNSSINAYAVSFPDSTKVDCVFLNAHNTAGLRCAWGKPSVVKETSSKLLPSVESVGGENVRCVAYDGSKEGALDCEL